MALLVFQALWLNVIVPGHTRGIVTLPGSPCAEGMCDASRWSACCPGERDHSQKQPISRERAARCAICSFAARVTPSPVVDFTHPPLRFLHVMPAARTDRPEVAPGLVTYDGRAPPLA
jgi:hypothetical protein